jgi:hypothetical protein
MSDSDIEATSPENLLRIFRERFAIHSPYAVLPPDISADKLRANHPWLYRIVLVVASSHDRNQQIELGKQIAVDIAVAMITRGEKTLDMLQSLLVYNTWYVGIFLCCIVNLWGLQCCFPICVFMSGLKSDTSTQDILFFCR